MMALMAKMDLLGHLEKLAPRVTVVILVTKVQPEKRVLPEHQVNLVLPVKLAHKDREVIQVPLANAD